MKSFLLLFLLAYAIPGQADNCSNVDLRDKFGPVRNQDGVGWCYAFTAADMIGFKNQGKARISAADLVQQYMNSPVVKTQQIVATSEGNLAYRNVYKEGTDKYQGGQVYEILQIASQKNVCLEQFIPSEINGGPSIQEAYSRIISLSKHVQISDKYQAQCDSVAQAYRNYFPKTSIRDIQQIMRSTSYTSVISKLQQTNCPQRYAPGFNIDDVLVEKRDKLKMLQMIRTQMDRGQPTAIGYNTSLIVNGATGAHASILVGRRKNKAGVCEYLIRNSYGRSCDGYKNPSKCNQGNIWVSEYDLYQSLLTTTSFK